MKSSKMKRSIMIFANEVPVISALNPYRKIEDVFYDTWRRTNPRQVDQLLRSLDVTHISQEEKVNSIIDSFGLSPVVAELKMEAEAMNTGNQVAQTAAKIPDILPTNIPEPIKKEIVLEVTSQMSRNFGIRQESPAVEHYEKQQRIIVQERNLVFSKRKIGKSGLYDVFVGGKIDGKSNGKVIEVKNRMKHFMDPLPKYDIAQLQTYLFITGCIEGELVEHLRSEDNKTKLTKVPWDPLMWNDIITPYLLRFSGSLSNFMGDRNAQTEFLTGDKELQRDIIRSFWVNLEPSSA